MKPVSFVKDIKTPCSEKHEKEYSIPTLEELCQDTSCPGEELFPGGEQEALRRLDEHMEKTVHESHIATTSLYLQH